MSVESAVLLTGLNEKLQNMNASGFIRNSPVPLCPAGYRVDRLSVDVLRAVDTVDAGSAGVPIGVYGDGNCLFRTIALLMSGEEESWPEYRVRTALELEKNSQEYARQMVSHASVSLDGVQPRNFIPQLLSVQGIHELHVACTTYDLLFENALGAVIRDVEAKECVRSGNYASMHHLWALSTVTGCQINVLYPSFNSAISPFFNIVISPLEEVSSASQPGMLTVLWTSTASSVPPAVGFWQPNHFVPVLFPNTYQMESQLENEEMSFKSNLRSSYSDGQTSSSSSSSARGTQMSNYSGLRHTKKRKRAKRSRKSSAEISSLSSGSEEHTHKRTLTEKDKRQASQDDGYELLGHNSEPAAGFHTSSGNHTETVSSELSWDMCLCHSCPGRGDILQPFTNSTWVTLHKAAAIRRDATFFFLQDNNTIDESGSICEPKGVRHRQCYQTYTSTKVLAGIEKQKATVPAPAKKATEELFPRSSRSQVEKTDWAMCIFCQHTKKLKKQHWKEEPVVKCLTENGAASVKRAAVALQDSRLIVAVEGEDLIALDTVYHKSCFREYTRHISLHGYSSAGG